jgi:hypothetical protein
MMRRHLSWLAIATALLIILGSGRPGQIDAAFAQQASPKAIAAQVYEQHPELPLENQYVRSRNGKVATDVTLVSRLIEYHTLVKGRSPKFRFDWKMTLADYMGLNDYLTEGEYPGHAYLKSNPMERDITVVQSFNRQQRSDLVQALADLYAEPAASDPAHSPPSTTLPPQPAASPTNTPTKPTLRPLSPTNGADLLRPSSSTNQPAEPTGKAQFLVP